MNMDEDFDVGAAHGNDVRPRGVSKARLGDLDLQPNLSIFYRPHRHAAMIPLQMQFPKEAAMLFCNHVRSEIERSNGHSYVVTGGNQTAYKQIFDWIKSCTDSQSIEKFPDIPEPTKDPFTPTVNVLVASERLGIPAGSLSFHLKKRLTGCARKNLMSFAQVRNFYDVDSDLYDLDLKYIACTSIFNAWWDGRLDEAVSPTLMEELADMRDKIQELDEDLHNACKQREEEVRKKWAEKKAKKAAEEAGGDDSEWNKAGASANDAVVDHGWDDPAAAVSGDWDTPGNGLSQLKTPPSRDWDKENIGTGIPDTFNKRSKSDIAQDDHAVDTDIDFAPGQDWADEMNDHIIDPSIVSSMRW